MRRFVAAFTGGLLIFLAGCAHSKPPAPAAPGARSGGANVLPVQAVRGKIVSVNPRLKFVVIDFYLSPLPEVGQRMNVYRNNEKVGEVRISGPSMRSNVAADVTAGEASVSDEVRAD